MKILVTAAVLLALACPAAAEPEPTVTATPAQWKDMVAMVDAMIACTPKPEDDFPPECKRWRRLETQLGKQGLIHWRRGSVCKLAPRGPEKDRVGGRNCFNLHNPALTHLQNTPGP